MTINKERYSITNLTIASIPVREKVSPEVFQNEIVNQQSPVVIRGLVEDWNICKTANQSIEALGSYLQRLSNNQKGWVSLVKPEEKGRYFYKDDLKSCNFGRQLSPISTIINTLLQQKEQINPMGVYMDAAPANTVFPEFSAEHPMPYVPENTEARLWLGNSSRVAPHFDMSTNLACLVAGKRRFLLFPPEQVSNLYVGPLENTPGGAPVSMVDPHNPDVERYPNYIQALDHAMFAELQPGDAIYLPKLWWHYVESMGPLNLLVNYWWDSPTVSPLYSLYFATHTIRRLPEKERAALRAFFDHFVFGPNARDTLEHLPKHAWGIMNTDETPENDKAVRARLQKILTKVLTD